MQNTICSFYNMKDLAYSLMQSHQLNRYVSIHYVENGDITSLVTAAKSSDTSLIYKNVCLSVISFDILILNNLHESTKMYAVVFKIY